MKEGFRMKKRILIGMLVLAMCMGALSGCSNNKTKTSAQNNVAATDEEKELAKELIDRAPTKADKVSAGVVNETIKLLKAKYKFEDVKKIYIEGDTDTYVALGAGWYEDLFADSGIKVEIQQSVEDNEPTLMERGDLTFANRMLYPYMLDRQMGADITAVWNSENPEPEIVTVVVKADSPYKSFADLKGKKIASSAAGCPYSVLVELADHYGWKEGVDYYHVNTKEYINALLAGEVDAVVYHPDWNISAVLLSGEAKIIDTALKDGVYTGGGGSRVIFAPTEYVKNNPNVVKGYVKLMEVVGAYLVNNKEEAAKIQESQDRTPAKGTEFWIDSAASTYYTSSLSLDEIKENDKRFNEWLVEKDSNFTEILDLDNGFYAEEYFK